MCFLTFPPVEVIKLCLPFLDHSYNPIFLLFIESTKNFFLIIHYFWGRAYIKSILKNHARSYFLGNMVSVSRVIDDQYLLPCFPFLEDSKIMTDLPIKRIFPAVWKGMCPGSISTLISKSSVHVDCTSVLF